MQNQQQHIVTVDSHYKTAAVSWMTACTKGNKYPRINAEIDGILCTPNTRGYSE